jgi:nitroimidazol reductase NimA-like FMN-containing flavoprotein (pyridoxamine 5'-phosphate oxidase superfamily)
MKDLRAIEALLRSCPVGRLGTVTADGSPMVKPLNFVLHDGRIYFHSAREGEKIDDIRRDSRVCFEVDQPIALVQSSGSPCRAEYLYRSVIIRGRAQVVDDREERLTALRALMEKYQPDGGYGAFLEEKLAITAVVRIETDEMTGKEDLGPEELRQAVQHALAAGVPLPVVLVRS